MPYPNEHACRIKEPAQFTTMRRKNCDRKHDGKCIDVIYGKNRSGNMEEQAFRYAIEIWSEGEARSHCNSHEGKFEPATNKTKSEASPLVADAINRLKIMEGLKHAN